MLFVHCVVSSYAVIKHQIITTNLLQKSFKIFKNHYEKDLILKINACTFLIRMLQFAIFSYLTETL